MKNIAFYSLLILVLFPSTALSQTVMSGHAVMSGHSQMGSPAVIYHPNDVIRISVAFEGPDADKISLAKMNLSIASRLPSQPGFKTDIFPGESKRTGPNTFEVSYRIPDDQASGDYPLSQIRVVIDQSAPIELSYDSPADFPVRMFKIDNSKHIIKPTIKGVTELPKQ